MNKTLTGLALLTLMVGAEAQTAPPASSVTLFGVVDTVYENIGGSVASVNRLHNSGLASSRLGFRGTEDLGGGMSAGFWLEMGINSDTGAGLNTSTNNQATGATGGGGLTFNRRSTVSLMGNWGEIRAGRDFSPQFWNTALYDPFGLLGVGTNHAFNASTLAGAVANGTSVRTSNGVSYFLPGSLGGFNGQVQMALGENASNAANAKDGNTLGVRLGYAQGPVDVGVASSKSKLATGDISLNNLGGLYDLGVVRLMGGYYAYKAATAVAVNGKGYMLGAVAPIGQHELKISYGGYKTDEAGSPKSGKLSLGYVYNLSKRTALYATYARVTNAGGSSQTVFGPSGAVSGGAVNAANASSSGYDLGVKHSF